MPLIKFNRGGRNSPPNGGALSIASDQDILHFLDPQGKSKYVDASTAIKNSDIYSIVFQLSSDLANGTLKASQPRAQGILDNPSSTSNAHAFWQSMYTQLLLGGEAFAYRWRNRNGTDKTWEYLRPSQVQPFLLENGNGLIYNINFDEPNVGIMEAVPQTNVIHIRLASQNGGKTGISPLQSLVNELQIKDKSDELTLSALARSLIAPGVLKIQGGGLLNATEKASRSRQFMKQSESSKNGPIVLDDLEDYTPLEIKSNVAQLLSQVSWTSAQIAKVYGVSDAMLNGTGDQQSSIDMIAGQYIRSLNRFASAIESELRNKLGSNVHLDLRSSIDPLGDSLASRIDTLQKDGTLAQNQAQYVLKQFGYLPDDLPEAKVAQTQAKPVQVISTKGGADSEEDDD